MNKTGGFSFTEVLISLLLVSTSSLAVLTQQWHISQLFNDAYIRMNALLEIDNTFEGNE